MSDQRGWATVELPPDVMTPGPSIHVVPVVDRTDLTPANGHELHAYCWCHPRRLDNLLDDGVLMSHNEPGWPGARDDRVLPS